LDKLDKEEGPVDAVTLMTLHSAKGLEFPFVFLAGMEEGIFPHVRSMKEESDIEEERRLAYVGITRAERGLHLLRAITRTIFGQMSSNLPSRFLKEIPPQLIENVSQRRKAPESHRPRDSSFRVETELIDWNVGDQAEHKKWGIGSVTKVDGQGEEMELKIAFPKPYGDKRLLAKYAPIRKVEGV
jgi:DNA helicase-2/ATP-dependent DNA helicase PcrA